MNTEERQAKGKFVTAILNACRDIITEGDEYLNVLGKPFTEDPTKEESQKNIQHEAIPWVITQNQKGEPYERYPEYKKQPDTTNINYKALLEKIKTDKFHQHNGLNYWIFKDSITLGRKPKR